MSNIEKDEPRYYKSLRLTSEALAVVVREKAPWQDGEITIFHSPRGVGR